MLASLPLRRIVVSSLALAALLLAAGAARAADDGFEQRRSTHFLLREDVAIDHRTGPHGSTRFERDVLAVLEDGYDVLDKALDLQPRRRIDVQIYDAALFDQGFAGRFPFPAAGFFDGVICVRGDVQVTPQLARTLDHELLHAALHAAAPSLVLPAWFNEGLAEWFAARATGQPALSRGRRAFLVESARRGALLPLEAISEPSLQQLSAAEAPLAYLEATALVDEVARRGGERALRVLLAHLFRSGDLDRALVRAIGLDTRGLEAATVAELGLSR